LKRRPGQTAVGKGRSHYVISEDAKALERENRLLREQLRNIQQTYQEKIAELSMIREMNDILLHVHSFEYTCRILLNVIIENTVARNCSIMLLDPAKERLFLAGATDPSGKLFILEAWRLFSKEGITYFFRPGEGTAGRVLETRQPVLISDTESSSDFESDISSNVKIRSLFCMPLIIGKKAIGVLNLSHSRPDIFEPGDANLFNIISGVAAISLYSTLNYEKLKYSESKYRALTESINDGIAIVQEGMHVYANPRYLALTGYSHDQLKKIRFVELLAPGDENTTADAGSSLKALTTAPQTFEVKLRHREGEKAAVEINAAAITYSARPAFIISVRDLSERKELEKKLMHAQKLEAIGTLAGGVAHDLNNILGGLVSYPELLLLQLPEDSPLRKSILTIQKSGEKAAAVVQDLLTLARRGVVVTEVVNLNDVIAEYLKSPAYEILQSYHPGVHFETHLEKGTLNILGSPTHLSETVMNLVSNAAEAMPEGGRLTVSTENRYIDRPIRGYENVKEGDYVVLTVSDTGTGISPEDIGKIFEPFYTKKKMGRSGTGLGMAVVWGTVKDHNGYIHVESTEGKARPPRLRARDGGQGTTFALYFPVTRKSVEEKSEISLKDYIGKDEAILVVDDVEEQRKIVSGMLKELGYSVVSVSSGEEAVKYLKTNKVDLLVLDMIMDPGMDGLETYKKILEIHPGQKAIIASGFSETDRLKELHRLGAGAYIRKPFLLEKIGLAVKEELEG